MSSRKPDTAEHEEKCERCGISCRAAIKLSDGRQVVIEDLHCVHLEETGDGSYGCAVYEARFEKAHWCLHSTEAVRLGALRAGCPYSVQGASSGKERVGEDEYGKLWPEIATLLLTTSDLNPNFTWKQFVKAATRRERGLHWRVDFNAPKTAVRLSRLPTLWNTMKGRLGLAGGAEGE